MCTSQMATILRISHTNPRGCFGRAVDARTSRHTASISVRGWLECSTAKETQAILQRKADDGSRPVRLPAVEPFQLRVDDNVLADLRERLDRVRWPDEAPDGQPWQFGTDLGYLQELVAYWRDGFDWRAQEAALNQWPQYVETLAGAPLHFLHVPGEGPDPLPLVLSHGWPGSVVEFQKLIPLLTRPADPADAFTIVAPSLPGYTLSFRPGQPRFSQLQIADVFDTLMTETLGYPRYGAQGGDWGAFISAALGLNHAEHV